MSILKIVVEEVLLTVSEEVLSQTQGRLSVIALRGCLFLSDGGR